MNMLLFLPELRSNDPSVADLIAKEDDPDVYYLSMALLIKVLFIMIKEQWINGLLKVLFSLVKNELIFGIFLLV